jgi:hypothetical protein
VEINAPVCFVCSDDVLVNLEWGAEDMVAAGAQVLFSFGKNLDFSTVAFSFLFNKYYLIMD